ncbi:acylneuraminate cytidylyltransferase family protein [Halomonas saccharevitans]|uniref:Acylneuraminate cytidylyltransferase family protein n=1 Tax=Halomonas saccharevitans TaxID=416872 RepID=A0ABU3NAW8_9GAMM|nr:acylneuraminate cytidylyltransferase family protein [Halomonas saccharevitans]MDT8878314.1 acylneuraminate cytidylyltransferase family protein [Halomonas saccharevitans]
MRDKVTCFLPCRAGSQRVVRKNIKPFAGHHHGLIQIKLRQLLAAEGIDEVVLTTNDVDILAYAKSLGEPRLRLHRRVEELSSSATSTDQLVHHALELIPKGHILWTHVTSPFITAKHYDGVIRAYFEQRKLGYDSLMTTTAIFGFLWRGEKPMNYDRTVEKWPRTQTLAPVHEVNSGAFLAPAGLYRELDDRIGLRPYLYAMDKFTSFDIDWPEDFLIAECLVEKELATI